MLRRARLGVFDVVYRRKAGPLKVGWDEMYHAVDGYAGHYVDEETGTLVRECQIKFRVERHTS